MDGGLWETRGNADHLCNKWSVPHTGCQCMTNSISNFFFFKSLHRARSATRFEFFCSTKGMPGRNSLQSGISAIRGDMELICLIKCLTELAFGVQREFKQKGRDEIHSVEGEGGWHIVAVEEKGRVTSHRTGILLLVSVRPVPLINYI